jgi:2-polyprenyl-6-methoxyphenol hydroxylase-like FAD-dependent oxidoreductase
VSAFKLGRQEDDGLCRLGDAESIIPPFTGNGMSMALEGAAEAIEPLTAYASGQSSWSEATTSLRGCLQNRFAKRLLMARVLHPLFFSQTGRMLLASSARTGVLPFQALFRALR